jgi:hypothetical protein
MIGPEEFKKKKDEIVELMKLKTCTINNFRLQPNENEFKLTLHASKLQFISGTTIKPNEMSNMPDCFFKFMKFEDIKAMNFREDILVGSYSYQCTYNEFVLICWTFKQCNLTHSIFIKYHWCCS